MHIKSHMHNYTHMTRISRHSLGHSQCLLNISWEEHDMQQAGDRAYPFGPSVLPDYRTPKLVPISQIRRFGAYQLYISWIGSGVLSCNSNQDRVALHACREMPGDHILPSTERYVRATNPASGEPSTVRITICELATWSLLI